MRISRFALALPLVAGLAACQLKDGAQTQLLAKADSLRQDSLATMRSQLLDEVMASTQFVTSLNTELAKVRGLDGVRLAGGESKESDVAAMREERKATMARVQLVVARLDSMETKLAATRSRAQSLAKHDAKLARQIAEYDSTISGLRATMEQQRSEFQALVDKQTAQIASLSSQVDTLTQVRTALVDTVGQLTTEKNTAYYVVGTRDELVKKGILVEEGHKRFLMFGSRAVEPARNLDSSAFVRIDRLRDRTIQLPAGQYTIVSRHDPSLAVPQATKDGKLSGELQINQPERFWSASRYLIVVKS